MRRLSEIKNGDALDVLVDMFDPIMRILQDKEVSQYARVGKRAEAVKLAIKKHKKDVLTVLAIFDGADPETYEINVVQIPIKIFQLLNDPDMADFFASQGWRTSGESSGSATENTEAVENQ